MGHRRRRRHSSSDKTECLQIIVKLEDPDDPVCLGVLGTATPASYTTGGPIVWNATPQRNNFAPVNCGANPCRLRYTGVNSAGGANVTLTGFKYTTTLNSRGFIELIRQHPSGASDVIFSIFAASSVAHTVTLPPIPFRIFNLVRGDTFFIRWRPMISGARVTIPANTATLRVSCV